MNHEDEVNHEEHRAGGDRKGGIMPGDVRLYSSNANDAWDALEHEKKVRGQLHSSEDGRHCLLWFWSAREHIGRGDSYADAAIDLCSKLGLASKSSEQYAPRLIADGFVDAAAREEREAETSLSEPIPWSGCLVSFMVPLSALERAPDLYLHRGMPKGWELYCATPKGTHAKLEFTVDGEVKIEDGWSVQRVLEELGML